MTVQTASLYRGPTEEPRLYDAQRLSLAGYTATRALPSVTTILRVLNKPAFVPAALRAMGDYLQARTPEIKKAASEWDTDFTSYFLSEISLAKAAWGRRSRDAMDIGSRIHALCEAHGRGEHVALEDEPEQVQRGFGAYLAWISETGFVATEIEKVVANPQEGYAGTADAIGRLPDGTEILVDWKSGRGGAIYQEYLLQWHAYAAPLGIERGYIVSFDRDTGECYHHAIRFDTQTYRVFLAARDMWEWMEER